MSRRLASTFGRLATLASLTMVLTPALPYAATEDDSAVAAQTQPSDDGWFDLSDFIDGRFGFLPVVAPITEPAVGYGAAGGLAFVDKPARDALAGFGRPNVSFLGGARTENGTWGAAIGDLRHWSDDRLRTLTGGGYASVGLDFYGIGEGSLSTNPLHYVIEFAGGGVQAEHRLGGSRIWAGLGYAYATVSVDFDAPEGTPLLPQVQSESDVACLAFSMTYDSRDNVFTPNTGTYLQGSLAQFDEAFGGDSGFRRAQIVAIQYVELAERLHLGVRGDLTSSSSQTPFYLKPFVALRGAPAMRYQGDDALQVQVELRWQAWKRFSLIGFGGYGEARTEVERLDPLQTLRIRGVETGGFGLRYELARRHGIHAGADIGFGPDETAIYFVTGSAWARP